MKPPPRPAATIESTLRNLAQALLYTQALRPRPVPYAHVDHWLETVLSLIESVTHSPGKQELPHD